MSVIPFKVNACALTTTLNGTAVVPDLPKTTPLMAFMVVTALPVDPNVLATEPIVKVPVPALVTVNDVMAVSVKVPMICAAELLLIIVKDAALSTKLVSVV